MPTQFWNEATTALKVVLVIALAIIGRWLLFRAIILGVRQAVKRSDKVGDRTAHALGLDNTERYEGRLRTIGALTKSVTTFVIVIVALITILSLIGVPVTPLLASAGIGGVAIGFGAQSLVKDFLAGIAMIIEDQYGVGDLIDTGSASGIVEDVGLRVTRLRDTTGQIWYVRNGEILRVGNQSQGWSTAIADLPIAPDEDVAKALAVLEEAVADMNSDTAVTDFLLENPKVVGVNAMSPSAMTLRITAKTIPNKNLTVQRAILERAQNALTNAEIRQAISVVIPPMQI